MRVGVSWVRVEGREAGEGLVEGGGEGGRLGKACIRVEGREGKAWLRVEGREGGWGRLLLGLKK